MHRPAPSPKPHTYWPRLLSLWSSFSELSETLPPRRESSFCPKHNLTLNSGSVKYKQPETSTTEKTQKDAFADYKVTTHVRSTHQTRTGLPVLGNDTTAALGHWAAEHGCAKPTGRERTAIFHPLRTHFSFVPPESSTCTFLALGKQYANHINLITFFL